MNDPSLRHEPHYVRFARALALAGSLTAVPACGTAVTPGDGGSTPNDGGAADAFRADSGSVVDTGTSDGGTGEDAALADAGADVDAAFDCRTCTCGLTADDAGVPLCTGQAILDCGCAAVGPLSPPDLPALA